MGFSPFTTKSTNSATPQSSSSPSNNNNNTNTKNPLPPLKINESTPHRSNNNHSNNNGRNRQQSHESFVSSNSNLNLNLNLSHGHGNMMSTSASSSSGMSGRSDASGSGSASGHGYSGLSQTQQTQHRQQHQQRTLKRETSLTKMVDMWSASQMQMQQHQHCHPHQHQNQEHHDQHQQIQMQQGGRRSIDDRDLNNGNNNNQSRSPSKVSFSNIIEVRQLAPSSGTNASTPTAPPSSSSSSNAHTEPSSVATSSTNGFRSLFSRKRSVKNPSPTILSSAGGGGGSVNIEGLAHPVPKGQSKVNNKDKEREREREKERERKLGMVRSKSSESLRGGESQGQGQVQIVMRGQQAQAPGFQTSQQAYPVSGGGGGERSRSVTSYSSSSSGSQSASSSPRSKSNNDQSWRLPAEDDAGLSMMGSEMGGGGSPGGRRMGVMERRGSEGSLGGGNGNGSGDGLKVGLESPRSEGGKASPSLGGNNARTPSPSRSPLSQLAFSNNPAYPSPSHSNTSAPRSSSFNAIITGNDSTPAIPRPVSSASAPMFSSQATTSQQAPPTISISTAPATVIDVSDFSLESPRRSFRGRMSSRPSPSASPTSPVFSHFPSSKPSSSSSPTMAAFSTFDEDADHNKSGQEEEEGATQRTPQQRNVDEKQRAWLNVGLISTSPLSLDLEEAMFGNAAEENEQKDKVVVSVKLGEGMGGIDALPPRTPPAAHTSTVDPRNSPYRPTVFDSGSSHNSDRADVEDKEDDVMVVKPEPAFNPNRVTTQAGRRSSRRISQLGFAYANTGSGNKRESIIIRSQQSKIGGGSSTPPFTTTTDSTSWGFQPDGMVSSNSGNSIMSLASLGIVLPMDVLNEESEQQEQEQGPKEETAFVPMFNIIPATPVVNGAEFEGAKRESWEVGMMEGISKPEATPRVLEAALELKEEVLVKSTSAPSWQMISMDSEDSVVSDRGEHGPSTTLTSHKTSSSVSSATSDAFSFDSMTSMTSLSTSSTASSFPDVEEALGAMLASLSAGGNGPNELMVFPDYMISDAMDIPLENEKATKSGEPNSWTGLGFITGGSDDGDDASGEQGTPRLDNSHGFNFGLGLGIEAPISRQQVSVTSPLVLPSERTPMVNHKIPFYARAKPSPSAVVAQLSDETPRQTSKVEESGAFEATYATSTTSHSRNDSVASTASSACGSSMTSSSSMSDLSDIEDLENASIAVVANKVQFTNSRTVQYSPQTGSPGGGFKIGWAL